MTKEQEIKELKKALKWFLDTYEPEKAYMRKVFEKAKKLIKEE